MSRHLDHPKGLLTGDVIHGVRREASGWCVVRVTQLLDRQKEAVVESRLSEAGAEQEAMRLNEKSGRR